MTVFVAGVDPGGITGVAILSHNAVIDAWQDELYPSLRRLILWVRENRSAIGRVGIEDAFMGKGPRSSLSVARSGGKVEGALFISGYPVDRVHLLLPSVWRKEVGVVGKDREEKEASARVIAAGMMCRTFSKAETHTAEALLIAQVTWNRLARADGLALRRL